MINKIKDFFRNRLRRKNSDELDPPDLDSELESVEEEAPKTLPEPPASVLTLKEKLARLWAKLAPKKTAAPATLSSGDSTRKFGFKLPEFKRPSLPKAGGGTALSPNLERLSEKFLSRSSRETIHHISLVLIICGVTYTMGKVTALFLKGKPQIEAPRGAAVIIPFERELNVGTLAQVRTINIFRTNTVGGKKKQADTKCEVAQQNSSLPIRLVNTVVLQDSVKSLASVQVRGDRDLKEFREGDEIDNLAKIFKITRLELLVRNLENGTCESIASDRRERSSPLSVMSPGQAKTFLQNKKMTGIENQGNKFKIKKSLLQDKLKEIGKIVQDARAIKIQNPDGTLSFKITEIVPDSIYTYLGIQDGDIISSINGQPINDLNEVMNLFGRLQNLENLKLGIRRDGTETDQEYNIQ